MQLFTHVTEFALIHIWLHVCGVDRSHPWLLTNILVKKLTYMWMYTVLIPSFICCHFDPKSIFYLFIFWGYIINLRLVLCCRFGAYRLKLSVLVYRHFGLSPFWLGFHLSACTCLSHSSFSSPLKSVHKWFISNKFIWPFTIYRKWKTFWRWLCCILQYEIHWKRKIHFRASNYHQVCLHLSAHNVLNHHFKTNDSFSNFLNHKKGRQQGFYLYTCI